MGMRLRGEALGASYLPPDYLRVAGPCMAALARRSAQISGACASWNDLKHDRLSRHRYTYMLDSGSWTLPPGIPSLDPHPGKTRH